MNEPSLLGTDAACDAAPALPQEEKAGNPCTTEAMKNAHTIVLKPFHKLWLVSIFRAAAYQAPVWGELIRMLTPNVPASEREAVALAGMRRFIAAGMPIVREVERTLDELNAKDTRRV